MVNKFQQHIDELKKEIKDIQESIIKRQNSNNTTSKVYLRYLKLSKIEGLKGFTKALKMVKEEIERFRYLIVNANTISKNYIEISDFNYRLDELLKSLGVRLN